MLECGPVIGRCNSTLFRKTEHRSVIRILRTESEIRKNAIIVHPLLVSVDCRAAGNLKAYVCSKTEAKNN